MAQDNVGLKEKISDTDSPHTDLPETLEPDPPKGRKKRPAKNEPWTPGAPKKGLAEKRRILRERRRLRRDLKAKGVKGRKDFNAIAKSLGLVLWEDSSFLIGLRFLWDAVKSGLGLKSLLAAAASLLALLFLVSALTDKAGSFTINLTADMLKAGFILSETADFERQEARLFSQEMEEVNNITFSDISMNVDQVDGPHNGKNYIAYTFYIKNTGEETASYAYYLHLLSQSKEVAGAVWLMLFEDGRQIIYAQAMEGGAPEELFGFRDPLFADLAYDYDSQYYQRDGKYGVVTTPYAEEGVVAQGLVESIQPGDVHKYTVVIWIEGYDPDCTDAIFGGYAKYAMDFEKVGDDDHTSIFSGVYRTEYEDYDPLAQNAAP